MTAIAVTIRLSLLLTASWLLVGLVSPTADPFVVNLSWLVLIALALAIPASRRGLSRWISTGSLRRTAR